MSGATVALIRDGAPAPVPASPLTTDRDGKFVFAQLEAGAYRLLVSNPGYVRQEYLQKLASGETLKDLVIQITQTGNVGGRLWDNGGQPAVGVAVQLLKILSGLRAKGSLSLWA